MCLNCKVFVVFHLNQPTFTVHSAAIKCSSAQRHEAAAAENMDAEGKTLSLKCLIHTQRALDDK